MLRPYLQKVTFVARRSGAVKFIVVAVVIVNCEFHSFLFFSSPRPRKLTSVVDIQGLLRLSSSCSQASRCFCAARTFWKGPTCLGCAFLPCSPSRLCGRSCLVHPSSSVLSSVSPLHPLHVKRILDADALCVSQTWWELCPTSSSSRSAYVSPGFHENQLRLIMTVC